MSLWNTLFGLGNQYNQGQQNQQSQLGMNYMGLSSPGSIPVNLGNQHRSYYPKTIINSITINSNNIIAQTTYGEIECPLSLIEDIIKQIHNMKFNNKVDELLNE